MGEKSLEVMSEAKLYNEIIYSRFVKPNLGAKVMEIGSGIGNFTKMILKESDFLLATDIRDNYLSRLKKNKNRKLEVAFGDIEANVFKPTYTGFDTIVCLNVLEHIKNDQKALNNMYKKLNKNGKLIMLVPAHQEFYCLLDKNLGHFRRYNKKMLRNKMKKSGFKIVSEDYLNPISGIGWFVNGKILRKGIINTNLIKIFNLLLKPFVRIEKYFKPGFGLSVVIVSQK